MGGFKKANKIDSNITVKDMLEISDLNECEILAGETGLRRLISNISIIDAPDYYNWVKGEEFFLTSAYIFRNNMDEFEKAIIEMNRRGSSGLGIKLGRYFDTLPAIIKNLADQLEIPVISIPYDFAWIDIINPVMSKILNNTLVLLKRSEAIHNAFTDKALHDGTLLSVAKLLYGFVNNPVIISDYINFTNTCYPLQENKEKSIDRKGYFNNYKDISNYSENLKISEIPEIYKVNSSGSDNILSLIRINNYIIATIRVVENNRMFNKEDLVPLKHASNIIALKMQRMNETYENREKVRNQLVVDLVSQGKMPDTFTDIDNKQFDLSINLTYRYKVFLAKIYDNETKNKKSKRKIKDNIYRYVKDILIKNLSDEIITGIDSYNNIIFIVPEKVMQTSKFDSLSRSFSKWLYSELKELSSRDWLLAESNKHSGLKGINIAYEEALNTITISKQLNVNPNVVKYSDYSLYSLYNLKYQKDEIELFVKTTLGLFSNDKPINNLEELINTVELFVDSNCNYGLTAKKAFLHPNTIRYRISKFEHYSGNNLKLPHERLNVNIAIKLMKVLPILEMYSNN